MLRPLLALALALGSLPALADSPPETLTLSLADQALRFMLVQAGAFTQGSPLTEADREPDEVQRRVGLGRAFYVQITPVTRGQFAAFAAETGYRTEAERGGSGGSGWTGSGLAQRKEFTWRSPGFPQTDDHPVVLVTWDDALAFARWASARSGRAVRLPTEAEFEYAARGGTTTAWPTGDDVAAAAEAGWFKTGDGTRPVAQKRPNAFGLYDMAGNVYQWCSDVYGPYEAGEVADPEGRAPPAGEPLRRVLRGGSWLKQAKRGRSAARYRNTPGSRNADNGFRLVVEARGGAKAAAPDAAAPPAPLEAGPAGPPSLSDPGARPFLLVALLGIALPFVLAWLAWRWVRARLARGAAVQTRTAPDGFYVRAPGLQPGALVRYECVVDGVTLTDVVALAAGAETFVYTGGTPRQARVVEVLPDEAAAVRGAEEQPRAQREKEEPEPFLGGPRAY